MTSQRKPSISSRKLPKQERSRQLVEDILIAAGRVVAREGAHRFTAARVAEEAGISVGSLYQYFPNKEAILFRLQSDEWQETSGLLMGILGDRTVPPIERVRSVVREFVRSECAEAEMRNALNDAAPLYRDAPEAVALQKRGAQLAKSFLQEVLPDVSEAKRSVAADIMMITLKSVGKQLSEADFSPAEVEERAGALADMLCGYLESLQPQSPVSKTGIFK